VKHQTNPEAAVNPPTRWRASTRDGTKRLPRALELLDFAVPRWCGGEVIRGSGRRRAVQRVSFDTLRGIQIAQGRV
jgi:hypothetical protein